MSIAHRRIAAKSKRNSPGPGNGSLRKARADCEADRFHCQFGRATVANPAPLPRSHPSRTFLQASKAFESRSYLIQLNHGSSTRHDLRERPLDRPNTAPQASLERAFGG